MMLDHLGEKTAAAAILASIEHVLDTDARILAADMGGSGTTKPVGAAIAAAVRAGS